MKNITLITLIFSFLSCGIQSDQIFNYTPFDGIEAKVILKESESSYNDYSTIHFEYIIQNSSKAPIRLTANNIKAKINGQETIDTKYNSLASIPDADFVILDAESKHELFFIIGSSVLSGGIRNFNLTASGLSIEK